MKFGDLKLVDYTDSCISLEFHSSVAGKGKYKKDLGNLNSESERKQSSIFTNVQQVLSK